MSAEIIRKLASKVLRAEVAARNVKDVGATLDAISSNIRFDADGEIYVVTKDGDRDFGKSFDNFLDDVKINRPDLFRDGGQPNMSNGVNPFVKGPTFNITAQMAMLKLQPSLAAHYQAEAEAKS